jgi:hypothetical protein
MPSNQSKTCAIDHILNREPATNQLHVYIIHVIPVRIPKYNQTVLSILGSVSLFTGFALCTDSEDFYLWAL